MTTILKQYHEMKRKHPDAILLFRVGAFYETFGDDAIEVSRILNIALTRQSKGRRCVELTGFPHRALDSYLPKLVRAGKRVAICEHFVGPKQKPTIKRGIANQPDSLPNHTTLPNGLKVGEKEPLGSSEFHDMDGRFKIHNDRVGVFLAEGNCKWYFAPLILSPEDEQRYKLYTQLSWKYSEWIWIDEYDEGNLPQYYEELKELYYNFVSKYGYLHAPENSTMIKLDAYADNLDALERETTDSNGVKTYVLGRGLDEIQGRVRSILASKVHINVAALERLVTVFKSLIGLLYTLNEIRRKTAEICSLSSELKISPKKAFNGCYEDIMQPSLFKE
ncbi:MAG: hypothetical protein NC548_49565 [Lachnospiraceae bacterium]|nr:hypothetical protein [Lachnospiraceae bacterium]